MNNCPCCSRPLLRHVRHGSIYWFCSSCWQEMPNLSSDLLPAINSRLRLHHLLDTSTLPLATPCLDLGLADYSELTYQPS